MNDLIKRLDRQIDSMNERREIVKSITVGHSETAPITESIMLLMDCKAALSEPVASSQDVDEFIAATGFETSHTSGKLIRADNLRAWMAGHARVPVEPTDAMLDAMIPGSGVHKVGDLYRAMLTASKGPHNE